ncbi:Protein of unknown function [Chitinophaga sp. YR627]|uniref:DUF3828 domain-containing protein n=1 Tax=Chitinophaga sp. YR627 TaxID=1881041 RepID=UPI0008DF117F|nr:DUF3828 domain-containing protein [Chitinophaga sp. YR627]SFP01414.1 Protein of unknown function [Chitinophaga sp. YR627]
MKSKFAVIFFAIVSLFFSSYSRAQTNVPEAEGILTLKTFYAKYIVTFSEETDEVKLTKLRKQFCTAGLLKKYNKMKSDIDADPLLKAQDSDPAATTTLKVRKDAAKADTYVVAYQDMFTKKWINIKLHLIKEGNFYKIDAIL